MKTAIHKAAGFLMFLLALALLLVAADYTALDRALVFVILGFYLAGCAAILVKTLGRKPADSCSRAGWGSELAALPGSWRRWLLDEHSESGDGTAR